MSAVPSGAPGPIDLQRRAEEIFTEAIDKPKGERTAFISLRCAGDNALQEEITLLLKFAGEESAGFLDPAEIRRLTIGGAPLESAAADAKELAPGTRFAEFTIRGVLGVGGMGVVYEAEQDRPRRTVALKVIRRGLASPGLLRRFEHEAEILGCLQHPGIAQVFQAGAGMIGGTRRPYIAMELVQGMNLTRHARTMNLTTPEILTVMAGICDAVHHAHQRGIIHRDLKPGNILVEKVEAASEPGTHSDDRTGGGRVFMPKILDFGVARASHVDLRVTTIHTSAGQLIGTLAYMSPEQVLGNSADIDTRSDVYALGVILYELLTGRLPFDLDSRSIPEAARMIREDSPVRLSRFSRVYRGELDTIVSKAMEKDKSRRYQSAADLAEDLRRYLVGDPIQAKQDSALYVLRKALKRHRAAASVAALIAVGMFVFTVHALVQADSERLLTAEAEQSRTNAERERDRANETSLRLTQELTEAQIERGRLEGLAGHVPLAEDILWREHLKDPDSTTAAWGLRELYQRAPIRWTRVGLPGQTCGAVSADGRLIAMGSARDGGLIGLADGATGEMRTPYLKLPSAGAPQSIAIAPDSSWFFVGLTDGRAFIVTNTDNPEWCILGHTVIHPRGVRGSTISPDGSRLATTGIDGEIRIWDTSTWECVAAWTQKEPSGPMTFSSDARLLAAGCRAADGNVIARVWKIPEIEEVACFRARNETGCDAICFGMGDSEIWASGYDRVVTVFSLTDDFARPVPVDCGEGARLIVRSPAGSTQRIFVAGAEAVFNDGDPGSARSLGRQQFIVLGGGWIDESTVVVMTAAGIIRALDVRPDPGLTRVGGFTNWCFSTTFSPDGKLLAIGAGDGTVVILDTATLRRLHTVKFGTVRARTRALKFMADSRTLLAGSVDGIVRSIDVTTGEAVTRLPTGNAEIFALDVDPAERYCAVGYLDRVVRIWDLRTNTLVLESIRFEQRIEGLNFSPDGAVLATTGYNDGIQLWDARTWRPLERVSTTSFPWAPAFSPDGETLLVSTHAGTIDVFNAKTLVRRASFTAHQRLIPGLAYSPDGRLFATGAENGNIKVWDASTLRTLVSLEPGTGEVVAVAFNPTSDMLAAATGSRTTAVYDFRVLDGFVEGQRAYQRRRYGYDKPGETPASN